MLRELKDILAPLADEMIGMFDGQLYVHFTNLNSLPGLLKLIQDFQLNMSIHILCTRIDMIDHRTYRLIIG